MSSIEPRHNQYKIVSPMQAFADSLIGFGAHRFIQLASAHTKVYQYKFSYTGRYSHTYYPEDKPYGNVA